MSFSGLPLYLAPILVVTILKMVHTCYRIIWPYSTSSYTQACVAQAWDILRYTDCQRFVLLNNLIDSRLYRSGFWSFSTAIDTVRLGFVYRALIGIIAILELDIRNLDSLSEHNRRNFVFELASPKWLYTYTMPSITLTIQIDQIYSTSSDIKNIIYTFKTPNTNFPAFLVSTLSLTS